MNSHLLNDIKEIQHGMTPHQRYELKESLRDTLAYKYGDPITVLAILEASGLL